MKGNLIDMAVGIIIGSAFGKIVSSFVNDIVMPPLGLIIGNVNFTDIKITLKQSTIDASGEILAEPIVIQIGVFVQNFIDFTLMAFAIFIAVKGINKIRSQEYKKVGHC